MNLPIAKMIIMRLPMIRIIMGVTYSRVDSYGITYGLDVVIIYLGLVWLPYIIQYSPMVGMMVKNYQWLKKKVMGFPMAGMVVINLNMVMLIVLGLTLFG